MVGRWNSFWEGLFSGAMLVSGSVIVRMCCPKRNRGEWWKSCHFFLLFGGLNEQDFFLSPFLLTFPQIWVFSLSRKFIWRLPTNLFGKKLSSWKKRQNNSWGICFPCFHAQKKACVRLFGDFLRILPWDSSPWDLVWICWVGDFSEGFYHGKPSPFFTTTWGICGVIFSQPPWPKQS